MGVLVICVLVFTVICIVSFMYIYSFYALISFCKLRIFIVMYSLFCIFSFHHAIWHSSANLTDVFPCFFLSYKANARVYLTKTRRAVNSS